MKLARPLLKTSLGLLDNYLEKRSLCRKNETYVNKTERSWELMELEFQENFKLKHGGKGEVWKNTQFG